MTDGGWTNKLYFGGNLAILRVPFEKERACQASIECE